MARQKILFFLLFFLVLNARTQNTPSPIRGQVRDARTLEVLGFAPLAFEKKGAVANEQGSFSLDPGSSSAGWVHCRFSGYAPDSLFWEPGRFLDFRLQPIGKDLQDVIISATLKETDKLDSPIPVETYRASFFLKNPTPNLFESLTMINGVQPQLNCAVCNTGDIHMNGMEGPYTLVLIDGMPIVSALSTVYGLSGIPNSLIKRVEVVKGPASSLYGSEAVGGLINIITKDPLSAPRLQAEAFSTSWLENSLDLGASRSFKKAHSLIGVNGFWYNTPFDRNSDGFTDITLQKRFSVFNKWSFDRRAGRSAGLAVRYVHEDRWGGQMNWTPAERGLDRIYGENILTRRVELIGNYDLPVSKEKLRLQYSWNYHFQNSWYGTMWYKGSQHTGFAQLLWDKKIGRHDLVAGLPIRYIWYDDNTPGTFSGPGEVPQNRPSVTWLPGLFVQDEWQWSSQLKGLLGLRYDRHNQHGSVWSPRIGVKFLPGPGHTFRLSSGNGFRVVNLFTEDHAALSGSRQVRIAENLRPEQSWNVNLNYTTQINIPGGFLGVDASLFYTRFQNKIIGDFLREPDAIVYENLKGYAISRGATLNLDFTLGRSWKMTTGATVLDVFNREPVDGSWEKVPQLFVPPVSATFQITRTFDRHRLVVDLTGRVYSPMHLPVVPNDFRPSRSPWFSLINLQVTKRLPRNMEVFGGIKNLLNFVPRDPILRPFDPFDRSIDQNNPNGYVFDPSYNYAPVQGIRFFGGIRVSLAKK